MSKKRTVTIVALSALAALAASSFAFAGVPDSGTQAARAKAAECKVSIVCVPDGEKASASGLRTDEYGGRYFVTEEGGVITVSPAAGKTVSGSDAQYVVSVRDAVEIGQDNR